MTQMHWTVFWTLWEREREGRGIIWENGIETCIISYMKWITSPGSMHDTGCSQLVHWDDPEGWDGEGGGRGSGWGTHIHPWWIHVNVWQNQYNIVSSLQLNKFKLKKKTKKNRFFWTVVLEKTLASPLDCKEIQPVHSEGDESWAQTHIHRVSDAIQPSHPLSSPSPPAPNPSQHQSLFQWVNSSHEVAKVLEFQL